MQHKDLSRLAIMHLYPLRESSSLITITWRSTWVRETLTCREEVGDSTSKIWQKPGGFWDGYDHVMAFNRWKQIGHVSCNNQQSLCSSLNIVLREISWWLMMMTFLGAEYAGSLLRSCLAQKKDNHIALKRGFFCVTVLESRGPYPNLRLESQNKVWMGILSEGSLE